jgi:hypothetical protein
VKLCQLQLGAAFMLNLNARVHKISGVMVEWWWSDGVKVLKVNKKLKVLTPHSC